MKIHPTAIIDPGAILHPGVEIGPYCIVEKGAEIGEGSYLESHVKIHGSVKMGKNNKIYHGTALGGTPQDLAFKPETKSYLIIGDNNTIKEFANYHRASKEGSATKIGNGNFLMGHTHIAHDCVVGDNCIMVSCACLAGHVIAGNNVFVSGVSAVHQFVVLGNNAMIAGCSKIVKDIPPFVTADGNPATVIGLNTVGLKRAGFPADVRTAIKKAYKVFYHSGLNTKQALAEMAKEQNHIPEVQMIIDFFANSKRGVTDHRSVGGGEKEEE